jgi:hypothetical protein
MPGRITQGEIIFQKIYYILKNSYQGIRYSNLVRNVSQVLPEMNTNIIHANVYAFKQRID